MSPSDHNEPLAAYPSIPVLAWLELFYDLVFVAAVLVFSSTVSHLDDWGDIGRVVVSFIAIWCIWVSTTMFTNRFKIHDFTQRALVLTQMVLIAVFSVEISEGLVRDFALRSLTYAGLVATVALMYWRVSRQKSDLASYARNYSIYALIAALIFIVSGFTPNGIRETIWIIGLLTIMAPTIMQSNYFGRFAPLDERHVVERFGALTIIMCGENFIKVATSVGNSADTTIDLTALILQFILIFAIWASYFEDVPDSGIAPGRFAYWVNLHLLLQMSIAGIAIGVATLVSVDPLGRAPAEAILSIGFLLALLYLALAFLGVCTRRYPTGPLFYLRSATAATVAILTFIVWVVPEINVISGLATLVAVAVAHAFLANRLRRSTKVDFLVSASK
ncbi:MAG: low temperature requirement protein A [Actinobacteria bacterium]|nr:low temperature requirement protein A [Actinomycetota bacterium]